nr:transposase [Providencia sp. PROV197]
MAPIFLKKKIVERYWRQAIIALLRENYATLNLPTTGFEHIRDYRDLCQFLEAEYQRRWKIDFTKKTRNPRQNVNYLGHRTGRHHTQRLSQEEMLWRYISHIPSRHFKMVRYYGFLANRKRGVLLPKVYEALGMIVKHFTNVDPYQCVLCGSRMVFNCAEAGLRAETLLDMRRQQFKTARWLRQAAEA